MILIDLFESRMSELDIEYQDWKNLEPVAFYSRYKMSKDQWAGEHWSLIKGDQTVHEQTMAEGEIYDLEKEYGYEKPKTKPKVPSGSTPPTRRHPEDTDFMDPVERRLRADQERVKKAWADHRVKQKSQGVAEGAMKNLHTELADKYQELAPKIEKYKDSFLAGQLYDALEAIAIEHNAELELKRMMTGARNRAHMDYDTNPGGFQNWFWYLPFADDEAKGMLEATKVQENNNPKFATLIKNIQARLNKDDYKRPEVMKRVAQMVQQADPNVQDAMITAQQLVQQYGQGPVPAQTHIGGMKIVPTKLKPGETPQGINAYNQSLGQAPIYKTNEQELDEKQDACYHKVKSRYKVWPSAYASGALVQCRKKGAANWGNKSKE